MSQKNVELVREGFARWNEGDYDFFFNSSTPDIELLSRFGSLTGEPYRGHEGVREWLADIQQSFERFDLWLDDVRDLGDEVLAIGGINLRARGSGLDMKEPMGWVVEFRGGRVARMRFYAPPADALPFSARREAGGDWVADRLGRQTVWHGAAVGRARCPRPPPLAARSGRRLRPPWVEGLEKPFASGSARLRRG